MTLKVVGAGLGRTGTTSLKFALERLLGGRCYHMLEVMHRPEHMAGWRAAALGEPPHWQTFFAGFEAAVDWPAAAFWRELADAFPTAVIVLSVRDAEAWWQSASATIFPAGARASGPWREMIDAVFGRRFTTDLTNKKRCIELYNAHVAEVRRNAPRERLLEWQPSDGWQPLCRALGVAVPDLPFPHENTSGQFRSKVTPVV